MMDNELAPPLEEVGEPGPFYLTLQEDHIDRPRQHLKHYDPKSSPSRAHPLAELEAYRRRMGWHFPWGSFYGSDFNYDFPRLVYQGSGRPRPRRLQFRDDHWRCPLTTAKNCPATRFLRLDWARAEAALERR
jgi:predicted dithiol-disulfide oxidoreductase (DUF899 family)